MHVQTTLLLAVAAHVRQTLRLALRHRGLVAYAEGGQDLIRQAVRLERILARVESRARGGLRDPKGGSLVQWQIERERALRDEARELARDRRRHEELQRQLARLRRRKSDRRRRP